MAVDGATPQAAPIAPQAAAKERRRASAWLVSGANVLLTQACYRHGHQEAPANGSRGFEERVSGSQWAQPPALAGEPSVLNDEPQAQLLTAFGLLIAKPEPMSEST